MAAVTASSVLAADLVASSSSCSAFDFGSSVFFNSASASVTALAAALNLSFADLNFSFASAGNFSSVALASAAVFAFASASAASLSMIAWSGGDFSLAVFNSAAA